MFSKAARVKLRRFHRWAGIFIGIQLLFWIGSGAYFAWVPIEVIRDEDRKAELVLDALPMESLASLQSLQLPADFKTKNLRLEAAPAGFIYRLESRSGQVAVFDALTGNPLAHLQPEKLMTLALQQMHKVERADQIKLQLLQTAPEEYKGPLPVFQLVFDDFRQTRVYVDPWTGRVIVRRNIFWRVYDFLWMLHIMDFEAREDFNNVWLKGLSLSALVFVVSGYLLFYLGRAPGNKHRVPARGSADPRGHVRNPE